MKSKKPPVKAGGKKPNTTLDKIITAAISKAMKGSGSSSAAFDEIQEQMPRGKILKSATLQSMLSRELICRAQDPRDKRMSRYRLPVRNPWLSKKWVGA